MNIHRPQKTSYSQYPLFLGAAGLLLVSPWIESSPPFLVMEGVGLLMIALVSFIHRGLLPVPKRIVVFIFCSILLLSAYLIPLPVDIWLQLPGRIFYQDIIQTLEKIGHPLVQHSISLDAYATSQTLLAILPALGVFLSALTLRNQQILLLSQIFIVMAVYQGIWGLSQSSTERSAHGSYYNYDHYAALMELAIPIAISLFIAAVIQQRQQRHHSTSHSWLKPGLYGLSIIIIFMGSVFSTSRAGIAGTFLAILLSLLVLTKQFKTKHKIIIISILIVVATLLIASADRTLIPTINRFIGQDPLQDSRWIFYKQAWEGMSLFFPLGSGPGTFNNVYTALQPLENRNIFVNHAHNDYLELLFETGIIGLFIILGFTLLYLYGWFNLFKIHTAMPLTNPQDLLQIGAGISIFTSLFHAFFDFNYHTYAHPVQVAFLLGVFFRLSMIFQQK